MTEYVGKIATLAKIKQPKVSESTFARYYQDLHIVNKPFLFDGTNGSAVLLIHGWTSTPYEMRMLGKRLNQDGYTVYAPLLSGHGTKPEDLETMQWETWMTDVEQAFDKLKKNHNRVVVGGMSMGGSLSLHLAQQRDDVSALVLMGTPHRLRYEWFGRIGGKISRLFQTYKRKTYPRIFGVKPGVTQLITYQTYPIDSGFEAMEAIRTATENLEQVSQPCLIVQSNRDHLITMDSSNRIHKGISSKKKAIITVRNAYHNFIGDEEHMHVHEKIAAFIKNH